MRQGGLIRAGLIVSGERVALVLSAHRAVADEQSLERVLADVVAQASGSSGRWRWSRRSRRSARKRTARSAPRRPSECEGLLARLDEPGELSGDKPRPQLQDQSVRTTCVELGAPALSALRSLAERARVSEEAVALAAFSLLLGRYTRKREILLGRRVVPSTGACGPFDNETVFASELGKLNEQSAGALLAETERRLLEVKRFEQVPFEALLEDLAPPRDASRSPVFQIGFSFARRVPLSSGFDRPSLPRGGSPLDLAVAIELDESAPGVRMGRVTTVESSGMFSDPARPGRLVRHLETLLVGMARDFDAPHDSLAIVGDEERAFLVQQVNPAKPFLSEDTIAARVERAARAAPDDIAVVCKGDRLSYGEL